MKEIPLTQGKVAIIDDADYEAVSKYIWYADIRTKKRAENCYARTGRNSHTIMMHRLITGAPKGMDVDHINRNGLDNRRSNLRVCSRSNNNANTGPQRNNKFGYKGVWAKKNKYRSCIHANNKTIHLGYFDTPEEAARAYDAKAKEIFGEFALLNFPEG